MKKFVAKIRSSNFLFKRIGHKSKELVVIMKNPIQGLGPNLKLGYQLHPRTLC